MPSTSASRLEQQLWPKGYRSDVWMVVDAARDQRIFGMLLESRLEYSCLYTNVDPLLETLAPYLMQLEFEDPRCRRLLEHAWGNSWGIFLHCDTTLDRLRRHLRRFLTVRDPIGEKLLFRYYDPRVLRTYLPACSTEDLRSVFGPIARFTMEGQTGKTIMEFGFDGSKLLVHECSLESSDPSPLPSIGARIEPRSFRPPPIIFEIKRSQLAVFSLAEAKKFEDWMVGHLNKFFPRECRMMGDLKLRETILYGTKRAATYGLMSKRDVCKYIDVMIVLGRDFDQDLRYRWAGPLLQGTMDPGAKMQTLLEAAKSHLKAR